MPSHNKKHHQVTTNQPNQLNHKHDKQATKIKPAKQTTPSTQNQISIIPKQKHQKRQTEKPQT